MITIPFKDIFNKTKENNSFSIKYLTNLFNEYNQNINRLPIYCDNPLIAINSFIPLPTTLLLSSLYSNNNKIIKNKNKYEFHGTTGNRILFSDKILPWIGKHNFPIPFTFPICNDNYIHLVLSNVYYYEVIIGDKVNQQSWQDECISIGFGHKNTLFESHVGWYDGSIGFHSDDGSIRRNCIDNSATKISKPWLQGDVVGAGLIYINKNIVKPFFTLNGKLIYTYDDLIVINKPFFPMIGYDHSHSIEVNFSNTKFSFDIKTLIDEYSYYNISTNNSFIENYNVNLYLNDPPLNNKKLLFNSLSNTIIYQYLDVNNID